LFCIDSVRATARIVRVDTTDPVPDDGPNLPCDRSDDGRAVEVRRRLRFSAESPGRVIWFAETRSTVVDPSQASLLWPIVGPDDPVRVE
jgi:hypothetical protein